MIEIDLFEIFKSTSSIKPNWLILIIRTFFEINLISINLIKHNLLIILKIVTIKHTSKHH